MTNNKIIRFIKKKNKTKLVTLTAYSKNIASIIDKSEVFSKNVYHRKT